ncbi:MULTISPECIES: hypothetical protein [Pseudovibrio]|uniref:hypothetical protein n=1 Tax=Stappiaceae TaxID=2821832 RepID=UPI002365F304|nr:MULTISPECIES: hypothetical protein [Pseudovibrio]MDD7909398.1 hypothetical protein [Pseudovibrio exalbescens]MDX5594957.1 hypothetical protein [Pseudovibrio sp. SPO723]
MHLPEANRTDLELDELRLSFDERGFSFHHHIDNPGRIWRNLFTESEEVFVALTPGLTLAIKGALKPVRPFEEFSLEPRTRFDIVGTSWHECQWVYGYEIAGTEPLLRVMRKGGLLLEEDWTFYHSS